jgi:hypothetical protein
MHQIINTIHHYNRYALLAVLLFVIGRSVAGWLSRKPYTSLDNSLGGTLVGLAHLQLLTGLIQYFVTSTYTKAAMADMGAAMKNPLLRYFAVEHLTAMLIAVILIQVGRSSSRRKADGTARHKTMAIYTGIALLLIVVILAQKGILVGGLAAN